MPHPIHSTTAWYDKTCPEGVSSIADFFRTLEFWGNKGPLLFRGEPAPYESALVPRIARSHRRFTPFRECMRLTTEEVDEITLAKEAFQAGAVRDRDIEVFEPDIPDEDAYWVPLAQHYDKATRLLDVTKDPRVALYFAAQPARDPFPNDTDGFVFFFFANGFCPQRRRQSEIVHTDIEIPWPRSYFDLFENTANHPVQIRDNVGYLLEPPSRNTRQREQRGLFIWWHPLGTNFPHQACPLKIRGSAKPRILSELADQNLSHSDLFPV